VICVKLLAQEVEIGTNDEALFEFDLNLPTTRDLELNMYSDFCAFGTVQAGILWNAIISRYRPPCMNIFISVVVV